MTGNKNAYNDALRKGHNLAWDGRVADAVDEYQSALGEFPEDLAAASSLGSALLRLGKLPEALAAYQAARRKSPRDLLGLAKSAEIQARLGQREEASASFAALAAAYGQLGLAANVLQVHEQFVSLVPDYLTGRLRLAEAYAAAGKSARASQEYLAAARLYQKQGQFAAAVSSLEQALVHDPRNRQASDLLQALRGGEPTAGSAQAEPTPSEIVAQAAQARLAEELFAGRPSAEPSPANPASRRQETLLGQALEYQARGQVSEAIASYEQVLREGGQRTEVDYNLGLLYQQAGRYAEAAAQLGRTAQVPGYAVGSHYALGQCYRSQGDHDRAMEHFLRAAAAVDLEAVERDQADDVIALYKSLAEGYQMRGQSERALGLVTSLAGALGKKGWEDKLSSVHAEIDAISTGEGKAVPGLPAVMPEWQEVSRKIAACDAYLKQEHYLAAIEECHDVVSLAPSYLPIHYRLAMIYERQGRPDHAVDKYLTLASLHLVRQEPSQAAEACHLAVQADPKAPTPRARLAQVYLKTSQKDKALEELDILGDLELERGNKEAAMAAIRQIIALSPAGVEGYQRLLAQLELRR